MGNKVLDELTHPTDFDVAPNHRSRRERAVFAPVFIGGTLLTGLSVLLLLLVV